MTTATAAPAVTCREVRHQVRRRLLAALGLVSVALGTLGIFVPGLPTTVFLLIASYFFARSSPALERRLHRHPRLGAYLAQARGRTMPLRAKVVSLAGMWGGIGISVAAMGHVGSPLPLAVIALGVVGSWAILVFTKTARGTAAGA